MAGRGGGGPAVLTHGLSPDSGTPTFQNKQSVLGAVGGVSAEAGDLEGDFGRTPAL